MLNFERRARPNKRVDALQLVVANGAVASDKAKTAIVLLIIFRICILLCLLFNVKVATTLRPLRGVNSGFTFCITQRVGINVLKT